MPETRRHAAIMFTDIVGYTRLMGSDEEKAVDMLSRNRSIHQSCIEKFNGTLIKEIGDGILASFSLASEAVRCAIEIQKECKEQGIPLKIGIHEGEMIFSGSDVIGDGVNIASRLQEDAQEGCINISGAVYGNIRNKADIQTTLIGERSYKNVGELVKVYRIVSEEESQNNGRKDDYQEKPKRNLTHYILAVLLTIIVIILVIWKFIPSNEKIEYEKSIAVLPFKNLSGNPDDQYLADGMMDAILNHLQRIEDLRVRSRTSVEQYRDPNRNLSVIGQELNANYILEGSFQKIGDAANLTVQLINAEKDEHLWSKDYKQDWIDIFQVQSEIAQKIAFELNAVISPETEKIIKSIPTTNMEAYEFAMRAKEYEQRYLHSFDDKDFYNTIRSAQKAIKHDPKLASPYVSIGWAYWIKFDWQNEEYLDSVLYFSNKALKIDSLIPDAYTLKGWYYKTIENYNLAIPEFEKALKIDAENFRAYKLLGLTYSILGEYELVFKNWKSAFNIKKDYRPVDYSDVAQFYFRIGALQKAETLSKESINSKPDWRWGLGLLVQVYYVTGRISECIITLKELIDLYPQDFEYYIKIAKLYAQDNNLNDAKKYLENGLLLMPENEHSEDLRVGYTYLKIGQKNKSIEILNTKKSIIIEKLGEKPNYNWSLHYELAAIESILDNKEEAIKHLRKFQKLTNFNNVYGQFIFVDPYFDNLRNDQDFIDILSDIRNQQSIAKAKVRDLEEKYGELFEN
jgi:TolB-like protein/class 3 adenylate cyclase